MKQRTKSNLIISIIASIGIVLILTALWFLREENRFSQYDNKEKGFSIKYPASWALEENINGAAVIFRSPVGNKLDFFRESVNVVVQDISGNPLSLKKYSVLAIHQMEEVFGENLVIIESEPIFFADQTGYKFAFLGKGLDTELRYLTVWTIKGRTAYQVTYTALLTSYELYLSEAMKMIKSFQFE